MTKIWLPRHLRQRNAEESTSVQRLKDVFKWTPPKKDSPAWVDQRLRAAFLQSDPRYRKHLKKHGLIAWGTAAAVRKNGAGLPADTVIREFANEYNNRSASHGIGSLPTSFNVLEAFYNFHPQYGIFVPERESDSICSMADFIDFTSNINGATETDLSSIKPDVIYNFSFLEKNGLWIFSTPSRKFSIRSASLIRREEELTIFCEIGIEADLQRETALVIKEKGLEKINPERTSIVADAGLRREAAPFSADATMWRHLAAIRISTETGLSAVRYILVDKGDSYTIYTDDPLSLRAYKRVLDSMPQASATDSMPQDSIGNIIDGYGDIFVIINRLSLLPRYFIENASRVTEEQAVTGIGEGPRDNSYSAAVRKSLVGQRIYRRTVRNIPSLEGSPTGAIFPKMQLHVERDGYWQNLAFGSYGEDQEGHRILGKTWVHKTLSSRESSIHSGIDGHLQNTPCTAILSADPGEIYVMRNASHQLDMFKVGLTRRSSGIRASELSRTTGSPDRFLVVQTWAVSDVVFAEKRIHQLLDSYRVNERREFFQAEYSTIRSVIDLVVSELAGRRIT